MRLVLRTTNTKKLFESVVAYVYRNGDRATAELELLSWRQLNSLSDIDADAFNRYYSLSTISENTSLKNLIINSFRNQEDVKKYQRLVKI